MNDILSKNRAWIELNLENLENNINEIKKYSLDSKIMAVVKANAYGHGTIEITKKLSKLGINFFAVASLDEAIVLRNNNITGDILILGYTSLEDIKYVKKYNLIQTIVDYDYFNNIDKLGININCHLKINTGMNRIGESYKNINNIIKIYNSKNINVTGIFTHLAVSDSSKTKDIVFTKNQLNNFDYVLQKLKENNINPGLSHALNSYGIVNYNQYKYDLVRAGIILYGIKNNNSYLNSEINLKPVLSLKSRITSIKTIDKNESVSYGRTFISKRKMTIASVSIGYADGIFRSLSNKKAYVYVNDKKAYIIGKICMDQLMIDVTNIKVNVGDIVTIIKDNKHLNDLSNKAGTISYELLTNLANRLPRIIISR